jgi:hypothetical protein
MGSTDQASDGCGVPQGWLPDLADPPQTRRIGQIGRMVAQGPHVPGMNAWATQRASRLRRGKRVRPAASCGLAAGKIGHPPAMMRLRCPGAALWHRDTRAPWRCVPNRPGGKRGRSSFSGQALEKSRVPFFGPVLFSVLRDYCFTRLKVNEVSCEPFSALNEVGLCHAPRRGRHIRKVSPFIS